MYFNIFTKKYYNVSFDSKLNWTAQVKLTIHKANKALNAIHFIRERGGVAELADASIVHPRDPGLNLCTDRN
jgi:hypothetical protein